MQNFKQNFDKRSLTEVALDSICSYEIEEAGGSLERYFLADDINGIYGDNFYDDEEKARKSLQDDIEATILSGTEKKISKKAWEKEVHDFYHLIEITYTLDKNGDIQEGEEEDIT